MLKKSKNDYCTIKEINAKQLRLELNTEYPSIEKIDGSIQKLIFSKEFSISLLDEIEASSGQIYKVNYIEENSAGSFVLTEELTTKTSRFLFPLLFHINEIASKYYYRVYFYNAYVYCNNYNIENCIYVVYRFFDTEKYKQLEKILTQNKNFIKLVDISGGKVLFIFKIPEKFEKELELFKKGKFLQYSPEAKNRIDCFYRKVDNVEVDQVAVDVIKDNKDRRIKLETELKCSIPKTMATISKPNEKEETLII